MSRICHEKSKKNEEILPAVQGPLSKSSSSKVCVTDDEGQLQQE